MNIDPQELLRIVRVHMTQEGADDLIRALTEAEAGVNKLATAWGKASALSQEFTSSVYVATKALDALGLNDVQKDLADYSKGLLASRLQFAKYGETIVETEANVTKIKDTFGFTRSEALSLRSAMEKTFLFANPAKDMVRIMEVMRDVVGNNVEEMQKMVASVDAVARSVPILKLLFDRGVMSGSREVAENSMKMYDALLLAGAASGNISLDVFNEQIGIIEAIRKSREDTVGLTEDEIKNLGLTITEDKKRADQLKENVRVMNDFKVLFEDVKILMAEKLQPTLKWIIDSIKEGGEGLKRSLATLGTIAKVLTVVGGIKIGRNIIGSLGGGALGKSGGIGKAAGAAGGLGGLGGLSSILAPYSQLGAIRVFVINPGGGVLHGRRRGAGAAGGVARASGALPAATVAAANLTRRQKLNQWANTPVAMPGFAKKAGAKIAGSKVGQSAAKWGARAPGIGLTGLGAIMASSAINDTFANSEQLSSGGVVQAGARTTGSVLGGAASGALMGAFLGPKGAAIGAVIGGTVSAFQLLTKTLDSTSESYKKANHNFNKALSERYEVAGSKERVYLDAQKRQVELDDEIHKEESRHSIMGHSIFSPGGINLGLGGGTSWLAEKVGIGPLGPDKKKIEAMKKEREELTKRAKELSPEVQRIRDEEQAREKVNNKLRTKLTILDNVTKIIEMQSNKVDQQAALYENVINLASRMGGRTSVDTGKDLRQAYKDYGDLIKMQELALTVFETVQSDVMKMIEEQAATGKEVDLTSSINKLKEAAKAAGEELGDDFLNDLNATAPAQALLMIQTKALELENSKVQTQHKRLNLLGKTAQMEAGNLKMAQAQTSLEEARLSLASNLAAGVGPSAAMQMELVNKIQSEIEVSKRMMAAHYKDMELLEEEAANATTKEKQDDVKAQMLELEISITEEHTKQLQLTSRQAQVTKTVRDGYISAIAAMATGAGMFTQITIDQNKNLGQLQAGTDNKTVGMRSGAFARGFTSSERFTPTGIQTEGRRFGASDEVNELIKASNPIATFMEMKDDVSGSVNETGAKFMKEWQETTGRMHSTVAAAFSGQQYGAGEMHEILNLEKDKVIEIGNTANAQKEAAAREPMDDAKMRELLGLKARITEEEAKSLQLASKQLELLRLNSEQAQGTLITNFKEYGPALPSSNYGDYGPEAPSSDPNGYGPVAPLNEEYKEKVFRKRLRPIDIPPAAVAGLPGIAGDQTGLAKYLAELNYSLIKTLPIVGPLMTVADVLAKEEISNSTKSPPIGTSKVEITISNHDKNVIIQNFIVEMTEMILGAVRKIEERIHNDLRVR